MLAFEDLKVDKTYKITEVIVNKQVSRNSYTGKKYNLYESKLIKKDNDIRMLTFELNNGWEKDIYYDLIGTGIRPTKNIEEI